MTYLLTYLKLESGLQSLDAVEAGAFNWLEEPHHLDHYSTRQMK